jgi:uncharacterized membrane protein (Fun14 family)
MSDYELPIDYLQNNPSLGEEDAKLQPINDNIQLVNENDGFSEIFTSEFLLANIGAPFVIGLAVGYFAKKALKIAIFLAGAAIVLLFVTEYYGLTSINDEHLKTMADSATQMAKESGGYLVERLSQITGKGISAVVGFFTGLKLG